MSLIAFPTLLRKLRNKEYRDAFVSSNVKHALARQIRSIREQRDWTQTEMGEKAGKPQNVISRLENPDYGQISIQTLLDIASTFDVGLLVRFVRFNEFISRNSDVTPKSFEVPEFGDELTQAIIEDSVTTTESKIDLDEMENVTYLSAKDYYYTYPNSNHMQA